MNFKENCLIFFGWIENSLLLHKQESSSNRKNLASYLDEYAAVSGEGTLGPNFSAECHQGKMRSS